MKTLQSRFFGDKNFYKHIFVVMLPIVVQNFITNFVNMLDNVMVGRLGELEMSAVSVTNTLLFVFNLCIFGAVSGAGIFTAQYHGKRDHKGVRDTFRFKLIICSVIAVLAVLLFLTSGDALISLYLKGEGKAEDAAQILTYARTYLDVMIVGLIPTAVSQAIAGTLRETDKGVPPMTAGLVAVAVNLILNYILIFGHFGAPRLGVAGAAIATVVSRFVEIAYLIIWILRHRGKNPFVEGLFIDFRIPKQLCLEIVKKGFPLMLNEGLWAAGIAFLAQRYSTRGLNVVAACNISNTFFNVFSVFFAAAGVAVGIIVGQQLGAGKTEEAKQDAGRLLVFSVMLGIGIAVLYAGMAFIAPHFYKTGEEVRRTATSLMLVTAVFMPADALLNGSYFMVRAGGKTLITMITDCGMLWLLQGTLSFILTRYTDISIIPLFTAVQACMIVKAAVSLFFVHSGRWAKTIVEEA